MGLDQAAVQPGNCAGGRYEASGITVKYVAANLRFLHAKVSLRKLSAGWALALRNVRQRCPRLKKLKECRF